MRVSAGDDAYIVKSWFPKNIGRVVHVDHWDDFLSMWCVTSKIPLMTESGLLTDGYAGDDRLRRIAGPSIKIEETTDEEVEA